MPTRAAVRFQHVSAKSAASASCAAGSFWPKAVREASPAGPRVISHLLIRPVLRLDGPRAPAPTSRGAIRRKAQGFDR